jgi:hypothetical protein
MLMLISAGFGCLLTAGPSWKTRAAGVQRRTIQASPAAGGLTAANPCRHQVSGGTFQGCYGDECCWCSQLLSAVAVNTGPALRDEMLPSATPHSCRPSANPLHSSICCSMPACAQQNQAAVPESGQSASQTVSQSMSQSH